jgi:hypothetical protein
VTLGDFNLWSLSLDFLNCAFDVRDKRRLRVYGTDNATIASSKCRGGFVSDMIT